MSATAQPTWPATPHDEDAVLEIVRNASMTLWAAEGEEANYAIRLWSPGAERVYGISEEEALGKNYLELFVSPAERGKAVIDHKDIVENGLVYEWNWEADDIAADGSPRTIITNCFRYWDPTRNKWLLAELGVDLKDKGDAERKLRALQESAIREAEAERSQSALQAFEILNDAIADVRQHGGGLQRIADAIPKAVQHALVGVAHTYVWIEGTKPGAELVAADEHSPTSHPFNLEMIVRRMRNRLANDPAATASDLTFFSHDPDTHEVTDVCAPGRRTLQKGFAVAPLLQANQLSGLYAVVFRHGHALDVKQRASLDALSKHAGWATAVGAVGEEMQHRRQMERERDRIETRTQVVEAVLHTVGNEAVFAAQRVDTLQQQLRSGQSDDGAVLSALEEVKKQLGLLNSAMDQFQEDLEGSDRPIDVPLIDVVKMVTNEHIGDVDIDIEVDVPKSLRVHAAKLLLREAIKCVVDNAVQILKLEDGGGVVRIIASLAETTDDVEVVLDIEDDGPGVADEDRSLIFRRGMSRRPKGTGRGLPIAENLMGMIGGSLQLVPGASTALGGAHFRFTVPAATGRIASEDGSGS